MAVIEINHVTKKYQQVTANDDISLTIMPGEIVGLIGENGAGKTTLINQILGLIPVTKGKISVLAQQPGSSSNRQAVGVMQQADLVMRDVRVIDVITWVHNLYPKPLDITEVLTLTDLTAAKNRQITALSGGQLRRLMFGLAIIGQPKLLILDEPTVGMDVLNRCNFWDYIRQLQQQGTTIIITSHYLDEIADVATRLVILTAGRINFDGPLAQLQQQIGRTKISFTSPDEQLAQQFKEDANITKIEYNKHAWMLRVIDSNQWMATYYQEILALTDLHIEATSLTEIFTNMVEG